MQTKKEIENEIHAMKGQLKALNAKESTIGQLITEKAKTEEVGSNLLTLLKYMMDENKKTNMILKGMSDNLERLESNLSTDYYEQEDQVGYLQENTRLAKVQPISGLDAKIVQIIQVSGMACADDIKKQMSYKGRNAASSRLNRLYRLGILERYQLGHKVYYKYDAGKTTNTLIVSPPQ
jgi:hypothetical protein